MCRPSPIPYPSLVATEWNDNPLIFFDLFFHLKFIKHLDRRQEFG